MAPLGPLKPQNCRHPAVAWSEDDLWMERISLTRAMLQIQIYPMRSENKSKRSLRFITTDGVEYRIPSVTMYTQPLDTALWLGTLGFFALAVITIAFVSKDVKSVGWNILWLYGVLVDQVQAVPRGRIGGRAARILLVQILFLWFLLAYVMSDHYRAVLNVNYITGNELVPKWHRIDQLWNFTAIYITMGPCTSDAARGSIGQEKLFPWRSLYHACTLTSKAYCKGPEDEVACLLSAEREDLIWAGQGGLCATYVQYMNQNESQLGRMTPDCQKERINVLRSLSRRLKYIRLDQLGSTVPTNLSKPKTALIISEAEFGQKWKVFEMAMRKDSRLKFSHNLFSPEDNTLANRDSRLQLVSGMKDEYTKVVTDRLNSLLTTGVWDFWIHVNTWRQKEGRVDRHHAITDFVPLTLRHDGMHLLFIGVGILWGLSALTFFMVLIGERLRRCCKLTRKGKKALEAKRFWDAD